MWVLVFWFGFVFVVLTGMQKKRLSIGFGGTEMLFIGFENIPPALHSFFSIFSN